MMLPVVLSEYCGYKGTTLASGMRTRAAASEGSP
jgi:hypothetical protein